MRWGASKGPPSPRARRRPGTAVAPLGIAGTSELHEAPYPLDAATHRVPSMDGIGEPMIPALDDHEIAWFGRPRVEDRAVLDGHHVVGVAVAREGAGDAGRRRVVAMGRELEQERRPDGRVAGDIVAEVLEAHGRVPRHHRDRVGSLGGEMERDEAAEARAQQAEPPVEPRVGVEMVQHRPGILEARGHGRLVFFTGRFAAAAEVEAGEGQPGPRELLAEQQVLVAVLGGAQAVAGEHARRGAGAVRKMEHESELAARERDGVSLVNHAQTRSKSWQAFVERRNITSSTGRCFSFATSSAARLASHGPEPIPANSPPYFHGPSLSTSKASSGTAATISRSRSR